MAIYFIAYSTVRFGLEFLRTDNQIVWLGLRMGQALSIGLFIIGLAVLVFKNYRKEV